MLNMFEYMICIVNISGNVSFYLYVFMFIWLVWTWCKCCWKWLWYYIFLFFLIIKLLYNEKAYIIKPVKPLNFWKPFHFWSAYLESIFLKFSSFSVFCSLFDAGIHPPRNITWQHIISLVLIYFHVTTDVTKASESFQTVLLWNQHFLRSGILRENCT